MSEDDRSRAVGITRVALPIASCLLPRGQFDLALGTPFGLGDPLRVILRVIVGQIPFALFQDRRRSPPCR